MSFDLGSAVRLTATCTDPGGTPATAATALLTVTLPDGTTVIPTVPAPVETGQYVVDYVTESPGQHAVRWLFTDPAFAVTDTFDVRPAAPRLILSLADARSHLRITTPADDADLREWLESITEGVENLAGAVVRRTVTEKHSVPFRGAGSLMLRTVPVLELVSLVPVLVGGWTYTPAEFDLDPTGVLQRIDRAPIYGPLRITTVVGRMVTPASITSASRIILRHLWRTRYGSSRALPSVGGDDDFLVTEPIPGFGYAIPNRALQLLEPFRLPPGLA